ncbi:MAG: molybdate ABC transporter substrate-binding protein [Deltaproteobacteria bacterium]
MFRRLSTYFFLIIGMTLFVCLEGNFMAIAAEKGKTTIFAAASTTNAITDIAKVFKEKNMGTVTYSFASSSTLAKQIASGAPADVYLSANPKWMNYLAEREMIEPESRFDLLGNRIVLIAPKDSTLKVKIAPKFNLAGILGDEKLAMGDPAHVPAGIYGKQALETLGVWKAVEPKVARCKDVRAALTLVERGEAPLGVVYATDAAISKKVKVIGVFPEDTHPPIVYPVALVKDRGTPTARRFLKFLTSPDAKSIFEKYGFTMRR